jgi:asparagine synthase (glutamine-hydrolysing)
VPLAKWFRGPLRERVHEAVLNPAMADSGYFNMDSLRQLLDLHQSSMRDCSSPLWSLLMFEAFLRQNA